jgi:thiaminase/transcriptional activator TenA
VTSWSAQLWQRVEPIYRAVLEHPFLTGLTNGDLDPACFGYYLSQDAHYLRQYSRALSVVAARAPTHALTGLFARQAGGTVDVELALHETLLPQLGLDPAQLDATPVSPTTTAYTSYLLAVGHGGTFADGLAAVLPCFWIYERVGAELVRIGSPDSRYQRWIDTYAGEEYAAAVAEVLAAADAVGRELTAAERERAAAHFVTTSRYEWMFWDAAWRRETWPL